MQVAVTGPSGHIGSACVDALLEAGHQVRALVRSSELPAHQGKVEVIRGDILKDESLIELLSGVDAVIHCAGVIKLRRDRAGHMMRVNVEGTRRLAKCALQAGVGRIIHMSSIQAYDLGPEGADVTEQNPPVGEGGGAYGKSKRDSELALAEELAGSSCSYVTLQPTAVIGPHDFGPSRTGRFISLLLQRRIPALVAGGYDFVDVRDVAEASVLALATEAVNETYLIGGYWKSSVELASEVCQVAGIAAPKRRVPLWLAKLGVPWEYMKSRKQAPLYTFESLRILDRAPRAVVTDKAQAKLHYEPRPWQQTVADTARWFAPKERP